MGDNNRYAMSLCRGKSPRTRVPFPKHCAQVLCDPKMKYFVAGCPVSDDVVNSIVCSGGAKVIVDKDKPYPGCCPKCPTGKE